MSVMRVEVLLGVLSFFTLPATGATQQATRAIPAASLVFDDVTVVDVEQGQLNAGRRVLVVGNHIRAVGDTTTVATPPGAQVMNAHGKYLIPGLWDMHTHPNERTEIYYPLFIAAGVTGIRDAHSRVPLDTLIRLRREVLAGERVGPPRQLLSGMPISERINCVPPTPCVGHDTVLARRLVDSLAAAGVDMLKMYDLTPPMYFTVAAEARRLGLPFGGHADGAADSTKFSHPAEASDDGARIIDHLSALLAPETKAGMLCLPPDGLEGCRTLAEHMKRNQTWFVPTAMVQTDLVGRTLDRGGRHANLTTDLRDLGVLFWADSVSNPYTPQALAEVLADSVGFGAFLHTAHAAGMGFLAGTDVHENFISWMPPGFSLHTELVLLVAWGLTPLEALQAATLNPAKMWHATDSLGTVAAGKLADLVLLDANPLADITNTTAIHAVVANGRYYDRAALDRLITGARSRR